MRLDQVFGLSAPTIELLVERFWQARQVGEDEAAVGPLRSGLDTGNDAALDGPAFGSVAEIAPAADLFPFTSQAAEGSILGERADLAQQHRIAS